MRLTLGLALSVSACSGGETTDTGAETGTKTTTITTTTTTTGCRRSLVCGTSTPTKAYLNVGLVMDPALVPQMQESAAGTFHGELYAEGDASEAGPNPDAVPLSTFDSAQMDFRSESTTDNSVTLDPAFDPQSVWVIGCLDTTGDGCECADPVPVPTELDLAAGDNFVTLTLDALTPCTP